LVKGPETFLGADFFKDAVYDGKDFDWHKMNLDSDVDAAKDFYERIDGWHITHGDAEQDHLSTP